MRNKREGLLLWGIIAGALMLLIQSTFIGAANKPLIIVVYLLILILPVFLRKPKISLGILLGYVSGYLLLVLMITVAYKVMLHFTKIL